MGYPATSTHLHDLVARFRAAWEAGDADLGDYLPPPGDAARHGTLRALIPVDLEMRWRRRQHILIEGYVAAFPELGAAERLPAAFVFEEYRARHLFGDRPPVAAYKLRFPDQFDELRLLVREQSPGSAGTTPPEPRLGATQETLGKTPFPEGPAGGHGLAPTLPPVGDEFGRQSDDMGNGYVGVERIGSGSFAEVWKALAPGGVTVAVKRIIRPIEHEEARREHESLELIKDLKHPFLLQTHASWFHDDRLHIAMELADGTLRQRLKECLKEGLPGVPVAELFRYFAESAEALDFLIGKQVLHRDLKPENILTLKGHAKVADFGLAKVLQQNQDVLSVTGAGTPRYMAPEVWRGRVSAHSDQYSLAMSYAELRLGRWPFRSTDMMNVMLDHVERLPDLEPLEEDEKAVLLRALAKDPEQRYPTCTDFVQALEQVLARELGRSDPVLKNPRAEVFSDGPDGSWGEPPGPGGSTGRKSRATPPDRRRLVASGAVGLVLLAGLAVLAPMIRDALWGGKEPPQAEVDWLPDGFRKADGAEVKTHNRRRFYNRVVRSRGGLEAVFLLISSDQGKSLPAFYVMEDKVTNGQFRAAADDAEYLERLGTYPKAFAAGEWKTGSPSRGRDDLPVLQMTVIEAHCFAAWLGGRLPSVAQWEKAAGFYDRPAQGDQPFFRGPFRGQGLPGEVAVGELPVPRAVGTSSGDVSVFGCHDMAGNGREWTRTLAGSGSTQTVPQLREEDPVLIRGQSFNARGPLLFDKVNPFTGGPGSQPVHDVGFRVVIEPSFDN